MNAVEMIANHFLVLADQKPRIGGWGSVRKAVDTRDGSFVAIKFLSGANDRILTKLFEREVSLLQKANRSGHPNIVRLVDSGVDDTSTPYLVLQWVEDSLKEVFDSEEPAGWEFFGKHVLRPVADAFSYLHQIGIEHRDLKPANILWEPGDPLGSPLLADFGIAKHHREVDDTSLTLGQAGTPLYSPPERDSKFRFVRDVYSLAVLTIQGLTPKKDRARELHELIPRLELLDLPAAVDALLRQSLDLDPEKRPQNAREFLLTLDRALAEAEPATPRLELRLNLTKSAVEQLVDAGGSREVAIRLLEQDLVGQTYGSLAWDPKTRTTDRSRFVLVGDAYRIVVKLDPEHRNFVILSVKSPDYEDLERVRESGLRLDEFVSWTFSSVLNPFAPSGSESELLQRLGDHHDAVQSDLDDDDLGMELLAAWRRVLTAREALGASQVGPIRYGAAVARGSDETCFELRVDLEEDLLGTEWQILGEGSRPLARGRVVQQSADSLTLRWFWPAAQIPKTGGTLSSYLGPSQIAIDRQRDAIHRLESGKAKLPELLGLIADPRKAQPPELISGIDWISKIDDGKQAAVAAGMGARDCVVVTGPPGTGKTRMISELVAQELKRKSDSRILLVSQTHVAIDNALERLCELGIPGIVRMGREDDSRVAASSKQLTLDTQLQSWAAGVRQRAETHFAEYSKNAGIPTEELRAAIHLQEWIVTHRRAEHLSERLREAQENTETTASRLELVDDPEELTKRIVELGERELELSAAANQSLNGVLDLSSSLDVEEARAAIDLILSQAPDGKRLLSLMELQADWLQRISSDERLATVYLASSSVVAGTCLGFIGHRAARDLSFDLCIVDEASKATSTEALVSLVRAERIVLVGDTHQLPPLDEDLLRRKDLLAENDITPELVTETLFDRMYRYLPDKNRFRLNKQYRMIPEIGAMISSCFYDGWLESAPKEPLPGYEVFGKPVLWLDTSRKKNRRESRDQRTAGSYVNHCEAELVVSRLESLDRAIQVGLISSPQGARLHVLVISPYRSQIDELHRRIGRVRQAIPNLDVDVESVDAVQGRECDLAIFSVTRSNQNRQLGFLGETYWRRINVALSRARYGLTIVGDADFCAESPGGLKRVIDYIRSNGTDCEVQAA